MSTEMRNVRTDWDGIDTEALRTALPRRISLDDMPALPLAGAADMPPQAGFPRGSLGLHIGGLALTLGEATALRPETSLDGHGRPVLTLSVQNIALEGRQTLQGTQVWETDLDGAGTGLPKGKRLGGADQNANVHPSWIATANLQQANLQSGGGHGPTLVDTYNTHRSSLNDLFTKPECVSFQTGWAIPAHTAMAEDTNTAVNNGTSINANSYTQGTITASYNDYAAAQNLAVMTTLQALASNPDDPTDPYVKAALATLQFMNSVLNNTNASSISGVPVHTPDMVMTYVQSGTPAPAPTVDDLNNYLNPPPGGGRDGQGSEGALRLSEDERAFVRRLQADIAADKARLQARKPVALVEGQLRAQLGCYVHLRFEARGGDAGRPFEGRVELDGFDLDFDDGDWERMLGPALAKAAREALAGARFLKSLLHDRIADALEKALVGAVAEIALSAHP